MSAIWEKVPGNDNVLELLSSTAAQPSGSYLFVGPPGVGKIAAARVFAAAILCEDQCGVCSSCTRALKGAHPDVSWIQPEGLSFPVESIREATSSAALSPLEGSRRVIVVEHADLIVERSQNALLKALEEPGVPVTWVLVADSLETFLPTVLSRCHIVEFVNIPEEVISQIISSKFDLTGEELTAVLSASRGDLDRALELAGSEQARELRSSAIAAACRQMTPEAAIGLVEEVQSWAAVLRKELDSEHASEMQGLEEVRSAPGWRKRAEDRHRRMVRAEETGLYENFLVWMGMAFRDLASISTGGSTESLTAPDKADDLIPVATRQSPGFWLEMVDNTLRAQIALRENANAGLVLESVLLRLT